MGVPDTIQACRRLIAHSVVAPEVEYSLFLAHILKVMSELNYELECSIPLLKKRSIGRSSPQEILVFRSTPEHPETEHRRHGSVRRGHDHDR